MSIRIIDLDPADEALKRRVAQLLVKGFREAYPEAWPNLEAALKEVEESLAPDRLSRVAIDEDGTVLGWIGGIRQYEGFAWEIHPLVVSPDHQGQGIGRALVHDLENLVRQRGACTLWLGSDDETNQTTLSGVDLYPNVCEHIANIKNLRNHAYEFYQRLGFTIVGVIPDANGPGKPDILLAKRVQE